jgi:glucosamine kinase
MILIADSGSTKTNWVLVDGGRIIFEVKTNGINPFFSNLELVSAELKKDLIPHVKGLVSKLYFYGAGIINEEKGAGIKRLLQELMPGVDVEPQSDLLAVAHATCGNHPGIACILGTGSNSCVYDGKKIIEQISPLGFILGDEGSGAVMGRKLIGDYFKNVMPADLRNKFTLKYNLKKEEVLERVYKNERPNLFLAQFTEFLSENIQSGYCSSFVRNEFESFVSRNILNYSGFENYPVNVVGSIGFVFKDILKEVLETYSLKCGVILKDPMEGLVVFHSVK